MPTILQLRRGTTTEHASFTGSEGEVTVNTSKDTLVVHDGSTQGGFEIALADGSNLTGASGIDTDNLSEGSSNLYHTTARARSAISVSGDLTYDSSTGVISFTNDAGDIESVAAGSGLTGGGTTGEVTLNIGAGTGITVNADDIAVNMSAFDTDDLSEGSTNVYYTDARVKSLLTTLDGSIVPSADVTYDLGSSTKQWRDIYVGPGSLYVNGQQVVSDNSGTITISADSNQNVAVQTSGSGDIELDPTGSGTVQIKGTLQIEDGQNITNSAGNDITFANNIKVDQITTKSTDTNLVLSGNGTGNVTVNDDINITGNLTVGGTTTTVNSETINLADNTIVLNSNFTSGSPTEDAGLSISRGGSTAKTFLWDETNDKWTIGSETFVAGTVEANLTGDVTGDVTGNADTATALATARTIGGVSFDGTANINLPGVNAAGNQDTSGNAATATALETARTIGGVSFDGTANINLPGVNTAGDQDTSGNAATATSAAAWTTARTLSLGGDLSGSVSIDGSANASLTATIGAGTVEFAMLAGANVQTSGESFSDSDTVLMTAAAANSRFRINIYDSSGTLLN